jgi:hypothetical protein
VEKCEGAFPGATSLASDDTDPLTRGAFEPAVARVAGWFSWFAWVQQGLLNVYLAYVLVALMAGLAWVSLGWGGP